MGNKLYDHLSSGTQSRIREYHPGTHRLTEPRTRWAVPEECPAEAGYHQSQVDSTEVVLLQYHPRWAFDIDTGASSEDVCAKEGGGESFRMPIRGG